MRKNLQKPINQLITVFAT